MSISIPFLQYFFYFIFFIIPFVFIPSVFNPYELPKFILIVAGAVLLGSLFLIGQVRRKNTHIYIGKVDIFVLLFLFSLFISDIFGVSPISSFTGSAYRLQGLLLYLSLGYIYMVVRSLLRGKSIVAKIFLIQLILIGLYFLIQFILTQYFGYSASLFQNRYHGTFGNPNFAGGYLAMLFSYILFVKNNLGRLYRLKPFAILTGGIAIVLTDSRSAFLAVIVVVVLYFFSLLKITKGNTRYIFTALLMFVIVSILTLLVNFSVLQKRSSEWENRSVIWNEGIQLFLKKPIIGYGQENIAYIFPKNLHFPVDNLHNILLDYSVSAGVFGVLTFVSLCIIAFIKSKMPAKMLMLSFLITAFFNPVSMSQLFIFWVILGQSSTTEK